MSSILNISSETNGNSFTSATSLPSQASTLASPSCPPSSCGTAAPPSSSSRGIEGPRSASPGGPPPTSLQTLPCGTEDAGTSRDLELAELALDIAAEDGDVPGNDQTNVDSDNEHSPPRGNREEKDKHHAKLKCPSCDNVAMVICSIFSLSVVVGSIFLVTWLFLNGLSRLTD